MIDSFYALLARIGFTDPPHALLTHMPIGLITGALLFFLVAVIFRRRVLAPTARHASILAFIFLFPTILFGVLDWLHYFRGRHDPAHQGQDRSWPRRCWSSWAPASSWAAG